MCCFPKILIMKEIAWLGNKISLHKANVLSFIHQEIGHLNSTLIVKSGSWESVLGAGTNLNT